MKSNVIDQLYGKSVYNINETQQPLILPKERYAGAILLSENLSNQFDDTLGKMLLAVKESKDDVLIKKLPENLSFSALYKATNVRWLMAFGFDPKVLALNINNEKYRVFKLDDCNLLFADKLSDVLSNKNLKLKLWAAQKLMFNIN